MYNQNIFQGQKMNLKQAFLLSAAGNAISSLQITVPQQRGRVLAYDVKACSNTLAEIDGVTITMNANGVSFLQDVPAIEFSPLYEPQNTIQPVNIKEGAVIQVDVTNDQANAILFYIELYLGGPADQR